ncbi:DUF1127 domain-containing protein [Radicibacter daui]|uniref:DUF1127 domain-containing protein n=1 Tax=Radicibacter daui TaxID=3064829 RepID=UPI004046CB5A
MSFALLLRTDRKAAASHRSGFSLSRTLARWSQRLATRRALDRLSDTGLKDIGFVRQGPADVSFFTGDGTRHDW